MSQRKAPSLRIFRTAMIINILYLTRLQDLKTLGLKRWPLEALMICDIGKNSTSGSFLSPTGLVISSFPADMR
jgi:hypothetical protein